MTAVSLEYTPTYAVATIVALMVAVSLVMERGLHHLKKWLQRSGRKSLANVVALIQEELMLLGFISLLLTILTDYISKMCVPSFATSLFLPCEYKETSTYYPPPPGRRLLTLLPSSDLNPLQSVESPEILRRKLAVATTSYCTEGKQEFVSLEGIHQLHIFIFLLAIVHICYSGITMLLASLKIHRWKKWEKDAQSLMKQCVELTVPERLKLMHNATFVRRHTQSAFIPLDQVKSSVEGGGEEGKKNTSGLLWVLCFFRQFGMSVSRPDYLTLRMAFITAHNAGLKFDFHRYLMRSMGSDFVHLVGTSVLLWIWVVLNLLLNIRGWNVLFWFDFIPLILALVIGTKLQHVIASLAIEGRNVGGVFALDNIRDRDALFWFKNTRVPLFFIHFIIFQNSFELSMYFWYMWAFGSSTCLMSDNRFLYVRLGLSVAVQFLCSYIILPLYCIVTQMGSNFKHTIFEEHVKSRIKEWARRHKGQSGRIGAPDSPNAEMGQMGQRRQMGTITEIPGSNVVDMDSIDIDSNEGSRREGRDGNGNGTHDKKRDEASYNYDDDSDDY